VIDWARDRVQAWTLIAVLIVSVEAGLAYQDDGPILKPKRSPAPAAGATLLVICDLTCNWKLDGDDMEGLAAGTTKKVAVSIGQHLLNAYTQDGLDKIENQIEIKGRGQVIVRLELQAARVARLKAEEAEKVQQLVPAPAPVAVKTAPAPLPAELEITLSPAVVAAVSIDNHARGDTDSTGHLQLSNLQQGLYELKITHPDYQAYDESVSLEPGLNKVSITLALQQSAWQVSYYYNRLHDYMPGLLLVSKMGIEFHGGHPIVKNSAKVPEGKDNFKVSCSEIKEVKENAIQLIPGFHVKSQTQKFNLDATNSGDIVNAILTACKKD
jgi:hypothetical protein